MADKFKIEVLDQAVQQGLAQLQQQGGDLKPTLEVVGRKLKTKVQLGFRSAQSPWGQKWAPLKLRSGQPLRDTGANLYGRLTYQIGQDEGGFHVDVGTNFKYAPVHQFGAVIKPVKAKMLRFMGPNGPIFAKQVVIPARPFLPITADGMLDLPEAWATDVLKALQAHYARVLSQ